MSEAKESEVTKSASTRSQSERLLKRLTSQPCIKKGEESCQSKEGSGDASAGSIKDADVDNEVKMQFATSTEVLESMRRESKSEDAPVTDIIKYSRGNSITSEVAKLKQTDSILNIRPDLSEKFRPGVVNQLIESIIKEVLADKEYSKDEAESWTKLITETIHERTKLQNFSRYKLVACVLLGERRGQGLSAAYRCLWDAEADCASSYTFVNVCEIWF